MQKGLSSILPQSVAIWTPCILSLVKRHRWKLFLCILNACSFLLARDRDLYFAGNVDLIVCTPELVSFQ